MIASPFRYLEKLVEEKGEPVGQHFLRHRLGPAERRDTKISIDFNGPKTEKKINTSCVDLI